MLVIKLFLTIALLILNGCASTPETKKEIEPVKIQGMKDKPKSSDIKTAIDPDVLFMLLTAEIAGQRGQFDVALEGYMEAAKRVRDPRFAERAAMIAMYMKDSKKTDEAVSVWLKQDEKNITARKIAAISSLRTGKKTEAIEHLHAMLNNDPAGFESAVIEIANALQKEGKITIINDALASVSQRNLDKAVVYYIRSILAMQMKDKVAAEMHINQALKIQPDWDKALIFQAQIAVFSGELDTAEALLKNAAVKYPGNAKIKKLLAQVLIKEEKYEQAGEIYRELIAVDAKDNDSLFALGLVYLQLEQERKAEDIFNKLLEQTDWADRACFYLGKIEEKRDNPMRAVVWFDKVTSGPFVFEASMSAIGVLAKNKQYADAERRLELLKNQFPKQKLRLILLEAELFTQQKQYQKSFDLLTAALSEAPEQQELLYTRALVAERLGKIDLLETDLKKILTKNPNNSEALNALGYTLVGIPQRYAEAEKYLLRALRLKPDEAVILDSYGWLQYKLGNHQKALSYLEKAYAKQKENEIAAHLAEVLWFLGRKDEAKKLFNKAIKEAPDDEYLLDFQHKVLNSAD